MVNFVPKPGRLNAGFDLTVVQPDLDHLLCWVVAIDNDVFRLQVHIVGNPYQDTIQVRADVIASEDKVILIAVKAEACRGLRTVKTTV